MIASKGVLIIPTTDVLRFAWNGLRRFSNIQGIRKKIIERWALPSSQHANAEKQAAQLGFCLAQAKEYFDAAEHSTLATRPMQLYYGCMSLALAEILWKGDGTMSLDRLRTKHAHHGLELQTGNLKLLDGVSPAEQIAASINNYRNPSGTFAAWQSVARNSPLVGMKTIQTPDGAVQISPSVMYLPDDSAVSMIPEAGISFLRCIKNIPAFFYFLHNVGTTSDLVRCTFVRKNVFAENRVTFADTITVHPSPPAAFSRVAEDFSFRAIMYEKIQNQELANGFILNLEYDNSLPAGSLHIPEGASINSKFTFLRQPESAISEFASYYVALYMSGMFCRYFPDIWMKHISSHTEFSIMVEHLCAEAIVRLPLLALSELDQMVYLPD